MSTDLQLNTATNDIVMLGGRPTTVNAAQDLKAQRIRNRILTIKGEWFADKTFGLDYYGIVWVKNMPQAVIAAHIQQTILLSCDPGDVIQNFVYKLNISARILTVSCQVVSQNGTVLTLSVVSAPATTGG